MNSNTTTSILLLIVGLLGGYFLGMQSVSVAPVQNTQNDMMNMHGSMQGMMSGLDGKTGTDLEKAFLDEMVVHHEGAVEMARALLNGTTRPELVKLGNDIITAQTGEIQMMKQWRAGWFK